MDTRGERRLPGAPGGSWYTWWQGDALPNLPSLPGLRAEAVTEPVRAATLAHLSATEARGRLANAHRLYVAFIDGVPVAWGWVAARTASIGELGLALQMPPGNRYLWSFETAPAARGHGIYPRLLQYILSHETPDVQRYWIGHEPGNTPSARGIRKAGFAYLGDITLLPDGAMLLVPASARMDRVRAGAAILGAGMVGEE